MTDPTETPRARHAETALARTGVAEDATHGAVSPPIYLSTTYVWPDAAEKPAFDYGRSANPTRVVLEQALTELEGGVGSIVTATGMAAADLALSLLRPGDLILAPHDCYGGTHRLLSARADRGHFDVVFVDQTDTAAVDAALAARKPAMVWIETPSNPLMRIADIAALSTRAKALGAVTVADNTFLSPARQQPIALGCDLVVHSTTKYLNGHTDVVGGALVAADDAMLAELRWWANCAGLTGAPFDAYQTLRGMRTLFTRMDRQEATAGFLAEQLSKDPRIIGTYYPGLSDHPGHAIAQAQQSGFGAMVSFALPDGPSAEAFLKALQLIPAAASLGGFETLACRPATMTHAGMAPDARREAGVHDGLIRLSIGLEHQDDLWADLDRGLAAASTARVPSPATDTA